MKSEAPTEVLSSVVLSACASLFAVCFRSVCCPGGARCGVSYLDLLSTKNPFVFLSVIPIRADISLALFDLIGSSLEITEYSISLERRDALTKNVLIKNSLSLRAPGD